MSLLAEKYPHSLVIFLGLLMSSLHPDRGMRDGVWVVITVMFLIVASDWIKLEIKKVYGLGWCRDEAGPGGIF